MALDSGLCKTCNFILGKAIAHEVRFSDEHEWQSFGGGSSARNRYLEYNTCSYSYRTSKIFWEENKNCRMCIAICKQYRHYSRGDRLDWFMKWRLHTKTDLTAK